MVIRLVARPYEARKIDALQDPDPVAQRPAGHGRALDRVVDEQEGHRRRPGAPLGRPATQLGEMARHHDPPQPGGREEGQQRAPHQVVPDVPEPAAVEHHACPRMAGEHADDRAPAAGAAQRGDITEELTRLRIHLDALTELLEREEPVGKSIEFLLQEINREVNTMGSKSQNAALAQLTVEVKGEAEKMREQIQNVE